MQLTSLLIFLIGLPQPGKKEEKIEKLREYVTKGMPHTPMMTIKSRLNTSKMHLSSIPHTHPLLIISPAVIHY